jgi:holo-[acyl-carrier protein] synthase
MFRIDKQPALAVGVDIVEVRRVRKALDRWGARFQDRVFSATEQTQCAGRVGSLAARFAAKEAAVKALGTGIGAVRWQDVETVVDRQGKPHLILHGRAEEVAGQLGLCDLAVSLSHTHELAMALVVGHRADSAIEA